MATNDITGDRLASRANSQAYADNYDRIFRKSISTKEEIAEFTEKYKSAEANWVNKMTAMINGDMAELDLKFKDKREKMDEADRASDYENVARSAAIATACTLASEPLPTSKKCLNCGCRTSNGNRWCSSDCRDDYCEREG